jgi:hypothetical protein
MDKTIILLYGCETELLTVWEEQTGGVFSEQVAGGGENIWAADRK